MTGDGRGPVRSGWGGPLFLERQSYRRRRLRDAARFLPVLVMALWLLPLLWPRGGAAGAVGTAQVILYVFGVWLGAIAATLLLALPLRHQEQGRAPGGDDGAGDDAP